jgi:hypothetical protein
VETQQLKRQRLSFDHPFPSGEKKNYIYLPEIDAFSFRVKDWSHKGLFFSKLRESGKSSSLTI